MGLNRQANKNEWAWRLLGAMVLLIACAVLLACLLAPHILRGLWAVGRHYPAGSGLQELDLPSITSRLVLIVLGLGIYPVLRATGCANLTCIGWKTDARWCREFCKNAWLGIWTITVLLLLAWWSGGYQWQPAAPARLLVYAVTYLISSDVVGSPRVCCWPCCCSMAFRYFLKKDGRNNNPMMEVTHEYRGKRRNCSIQG